MSSNMSSTNERYEAAAQKYNNAVNQYTGNAGYQNSLNQAAKGAGVEAVQAGNRAQTQARSAGMSKAAAALMGANNASNSYLNSFNNQQQNAANMGSQNVSAKATSMGAQQTEGQNAYNRAWGNVGTVATTTGQVVGGIASMMASDERLKNSQDISDYSKAYNQAKEMGSTEEKKDSDSGLGNIAGAISSVMKTKTASDVRLKHYREISSKLHAPVSFKSLKVEIKKHE